VVDVLRVTRLFSKNQLDAKEKQGRAKNRKDDKDDDFTPPHISLIAHHGTSDHQ
jgi:hypothetical protein